MVLMLINVDDDHARDQHNGFVDEDGVGLGDLAIVVKVEPGNVITTGHKAGVNVDGGLSGSRALRIQIGPKLIASSDNETG